MTITAQLIQVHGPASAAGTVIGTQALAAPANWTRITTAGTIPPNGCQLKISSDAEAFRYYVYDPVSSHDPAPGIIPDPRNNGILVPWFNGYAIVDGIESGENSQIWVKQA